MQSLEGLCSKQDRTHLSVQHLGSEIETHKAQISDLTKAHQDNAKLHEGTLTRLNKLEAEIQEVKRQASRSPSRPARPERGFADLSPRYARPQEARQEQNLMEEMAIIIAAWKDARRQTIQDEVMGYLDRAHLKDQAHSVVVQYVRSNIAKLLLKIPEDAGLASARRTQHCA